VAGSIIGIILSITRREASRWRRKLTEEYEHSGTLPAKLRSEGEASDAPSLIERRTRGALNVRSAFAKCT